ncbi:GIY-YIG nuclease family protein [Nitratifractor sp.]
MNRKTNPKTIKLFLLDGVPYGRMSCELSNWTGKAYKIPRNRIKESTERTELANTGVYFLFGKSDLDSEKNIVYIGEAENIIKRLLQHLNEKDYWNEAVIFISKDENLNKAHIKYLEHRFFQIAKEVDRFEIKNANTPTLPSISEPDQAEMEEFIDNTKMLVNILGFKVFEELRQSEENASESTTTFFIQAARGAEAKGQMTSEGFVVFKDSKIARSTVNSFPKNIKKLREKLIKEGIVQPMGEDYLFQKDYLFNSPSAAASLVMGRSANGLTEWKSKDGRILKSFESAE